MITVKVNGKGTSFTTAEEADKAIRQNWRNEHIAVIWRVPSGMKRVAYISVLDDGTLKDTYKQHKKCDIVSLIEAELVAS